jgi:hypothetical protein
MQRRIPDISKAHRLMGYAPKFTLDGIIEDLVQYYRQHEAPVTLTPKAGAEAQAVLSSPRAASGSIRASGGKPGLAGEGLGQ